MYDQTTEEVTELYRRESDDLYYQLTAAAATDCSASGPQKIPKALDEMSPGPYLGAILSSIDLARLTGNDVIRVLSAQHRQTSHHQSGMYAAIAEAAHSLDPDTTRRGKVVNEFASEEIGAALTLTRRTADRELGVAIDLVHHVPRAMESLKSGRIDHRKAALIASETSHLDAETADELTRKLLDEAPSLTTGQLAGRIRRLCMELDPESAFERYERSLLDRKLVAEPNADGTAALIISECSPENVYAARDHVNVLARRLKTRDESRTIDQLRADVAIGLLTGGIDNHTRSGGSVNIHVDLATLTRLSKAPADLGGYGPVVAEIARKVADDQTRANWSATVTDPETGEPLQTVALRRRPSSAQRRKIVAFHPTCVFPGCRMPANNCDLDHRIDHAKGGPTTVANHAPLCRRHHLTKHRGGWRYEKRGKTAVEWRSPLGATYRTARPP
jgi:hypothetical protein